MPRSVTPGLGVILMRGDLMMGCSLGFMTRWDLHTVADQRAPWKAPEGVNFLAAKP